MTTEELLVEVNRLVARLNRLPPRRRMKVLKQELEKLSPIESELTLNLVAVAVELTEVNMKTWEKITGFASAGVILTVLVVSAFVVPNPTPYQFFVFRILLALGAAGFVSIIPGMLHLEGTLESFKVRASGALAVFIVVFWVNPPALISEKQNEKTVAPSVDASPSDANTRDKVPGDVPTDHPPKKEK